MEVSIIAAVIIVGVIIQHILKLKEEKENRMEQGQENKTQQLKTEPDTIGLMFNTLSTLGCQPTKNDDETISVSYQGENFHMEFGGMYCRVWDPMWSGIKTDDPDLPKVREAVNAANFNFGPTVVMTAPNDEGVIGFHSRRDIMLHPACPDNVPFVKAVLDSFFEAKENVRTKFQELNAQQMEAQKKRRPVGFTTNPSNTQTGE
ncbi:MAG: hypothetical protein NC453_19900 [Muribaculum sp.]|nr:hypothetical protein [Muribaculum sp.]